MKYWLDCETDGLRDEYTKMWCASFEDEEGNTYDFILDGHEKGAERPISELAQWIKETAKRDSETPTFVCHNLYGYDLFAFRDLCGIAFGSNWIISPDNPCKFICTLDMSQSLWPDRPRPKNCPPSIKNPVTGKSKIIGGHGLEAYGWLLGNHKPAIHDWRDGDPRGYLYRCREDVTITKLTYQYLIREMNSNRL